MRSNTICITNGTNIRIRSFIVVTRDLSFNYLLQNDICKLTRVYPGEIWRYRRVTCANQHNKFIIMQFA